MSDPWYQHWLQLHLEPMPPSAKNPLTWYVAAHFLQQEMARAAHYAGRQTLNTETIIRGVKKFFLGADTAQQGGHTVLTGIRYHKTNPQVGDVRFG